MVAGYSVLFCDLAGTEGIPGATPTGTMADQGFSAAHLRAVASQLPQGTAEIVELNPLVPDGVPDAADACVLVLRNTNHRMANAALEEVKAIRYDTFNPSRGKVVNALSRHMVFLSTDGARAPNASTGEHTVVNFASLPTLNQARLFATNILGTDSCNSGCALKYPDILECGIRWHGDGERRQTIIYRVGNGSAMHPLCFQWYLQSLPIGEPLAIRLNHGDMAIASDKAVGTDWRTRKTPTLRHATGFAKEGHTPLPSSKAAKTAAKRKREEVSE